jgi:hypothetical protein
VANGGCEADMLIFGFINHIMKMNESCCHNSNTNILCVYIFCGPDIRAHLWLIPSTS